MASGVFGVLPGRSTLSGMDSEWSGGHRSGACLRRDASCSDYSLAIVMLLVPRGDWRECCRYVQLGKRLAHVCQAEDTANDGTQVGRSRAHPNPKSPQQTRNEYMKLKQNAVMSRTHNVVREY
jgi:hypothetical protein